MIETYYKDADETLDYKIDWSDSGALGTDTISSVEWFGVSGDLTKESQSHGDDYATVWISGGTAAASYGIVCRATTAAGRVLEETFTLSITAQQDVGELDEAETASTATSATDIVEAIDAHFLGQLQAGGAQDYMIQDKRITRYGLDDLIQLRETYTELARQQAAGITASSSRRYWSRARPIA